MPVDTTELIVSTWVYLDKQGNYTVSLRYCSLASVTLLHFSHLRRRLEHAHRQLAIKLVITHLPSLRACWNPTLRGLDKRRCRVFLWHEDGPEEPLSQPEFAGDACLFM
jgi:hypothetical protein